MADILLTHGYFLAEDEKERQIMKPYPPLGLLYLSAFLKSGGFSVAVFDSTFGEFAALEHTFEAKPGGIVGIYTNLMTRRNVLRIVRAAKRHRWTVILGGPESANYVAEYLGAGADVIVTGEGEVTLTELLRTLPNHGVHRLHGVHVEGQLAREFHGPAGVQQIAGLIRRFREAPPATWGDIALQQVRDYGRRELRSLPDNRVTAALTVSAGDLLIVDATAEDCRLQIGMRPSGTEPKIKFYFFVQAPRDDDVDRRIAQCRRLCLAAQTALEEWVAS